MKLIKIPRLITLSVIRFYQKTLSMDHGFLKPLFPYGYCRFHPSCSEYSYEAVSRYGVVFGGLKSIKRLLRCHPWNSGGYDPLK